MFNVLDRVNQLKNKLNWTDYRLSENSGITQITISAWNKENKIPSLTSVEKICGAFDITLAQFFNIDDKKLVLTDEQRYFINAFNMLSDNQKKELEKFIDNKIN